jgi:thiamine biosynthesis protein ThiI
MIFRVRFFPEIIIKSREVRQRYIAVLRRTLRTQLGQIGVDVTISGGWDGFNIELEDANPEHKQRVLNLLTHTPGIDLVLEVSNYPLVDLDGAIALAVTHNKSLIQGKSFAVRCKRVGKHPFSSMDVERGVGGALMLSTAGARVDLENPEVPVRVDIHHDEVSLVQAVHKGLGGYPLGTQDAVLSLISGGFDSTVSSYQCIKRGLLTHYCFFRLGGTEHELAVKEVALYLWLKFGASHRVKFITIPFEDVVEEIVTKVDNSQMGVVFKRMMYRAAADVADMLQIDTLVTGESVSQVASQTLANLAVIDRVTDKLVLRPLVTMDKRDIIDIARAIGTEDFVKNVPEYCGVISVRPTTRAHLPKIEGQEALFDMNILKRAVENAEIQMIDRVIEGIDRRGMQAVEYSDAKDAVTIIDVRHPEEEEKNPLECENLRQDIIKIPFYELRTRFGTLPSDRDYALYCEKGIMSRLHASHLQDEGHANVRVFRLSQS